MDRKIRVAQIIGRVAEGGVERMIINLYKHIDHSKVVFDFYVENTSVIVNQKEIEKMGGRVIIIPSYKHLGKFKKCLKENFLKNNYDIVHANMNALSFIPLKVAKKCGVKIRIAHSHSTSNKKEHIRHLIKNFLKLFSKKYATHFIACSEKAGRWLYGNKLYDSGKVEMINNAIDFNDFAFDNNKRLAIRKELGIKDNEILIGHIGRFCSQKNQEFLLEIYQHIYQNNKDVYLLMIGSGDAENIKNTIKNDSLDKAIVHDPVKCPQDYYNAMDLFVLPSLYEGLPVVGVEAQANGLKCFFSTDVTSEAKLCPDTEYIELDKGSSYWAERITDFINKKEKRGARQINNEFDINVMSKKLLNLYNKYLGEEAK